MRICITSGTFHPDVGGPPTYLAALADDLLERGHRVKVVTYGSARGGYRYRIRRISRELPVPRRLVDFTLSVLLEARSADLLYVNDYGLPSAAANSLLRKPLVMKIVGDFAWEYAMRHQLMSRDVGIDQFQCRHFGRKVEWLRRLQAWYATRAHLLVVPSQYLATLVSGWGVEPGRIRVVKNAPPPPTSEVEGEQLDLLVGRSSTSDFLLATVARLAPWKGVDVLIEAIRSTRERAPSVRLLVVGDGDERARLERLAAPLEGAVRFLGQVDRPTALALLGRVDAVALCSAYEGLSHVLLEAMAAGRPIVATAVGGNVELIRDGENGLLVPFGDVEALARAIARLATEPGLATRLSATAQAQATVNSWPNLVNSTIAVFREALTVRGPAG